jgi:hypothetical protein
MESAGVPARSPWYSGFFWLFEQFIEHPLDSIGARFLRPRIVDDLQHRRLGRVQA